MFRIQLNLFGFFSCYVTLQQNQIVTRQRKPEMFVKKILFLIPGFRFSVRARSLKHLILEVYSLMHLEIQHETKKSLN